DKAFPYGSRCEQEFLPGVLHAPGCRIEFSPIYSEFLGQFSGLQRVGCLPGRASVVRAEFQIAAQEQRKDRVMAIRCPAKIQRLFKDYITLYGPKKEQARTKTPEKTKYVKKQETVAKGLNSLKNAANKDLKEKGPAESYEKVRGKVLKALKPFSRTLKNDDLD